MKKILNNAPVISMASLGCPKNQVDGERMLYMLKEAGYSLTTDTGAADVVIVNTCGFIQSAKEESIETVLELAALKKEGRIKLIILTGCLAQRYKEDIICELPEVDVAVGIGDNENIVKIIQDALKGVFFKSCAENTSLSLEGGRLLTTLPFYAYLKIAEGCSNNCSYCAIPFIRGGYRSRTMENIIDEAQELVKDGVRELILIAQDTTRYGEDIYGKSMLPELLRKLCEIDGVKWIRPLYCYPEKISDELIQTIIENPRITRYLDIPIQHIDDIMLKSMNRRSDENQIRKLISKLRSAIPDISLRTSVIAGFPGETEEQFAKLMAFVGEAKFDHLGCFAYSQEENTPAAEFGGQLDEETKQRRAELISQKQDSINGELLDKKVGKTLTVVVEGYDRFAEMYFGRSEYEAPEIDGKIFFTSPSGLQIGDFVDINISEVLDYDLVGEKV